MRRANDPATEERGGDEVNPTARWVARGLWKAGVVIFLFLLAGVIIESVR